MYLICYGKEPFFYYKGLCSESVDTSIVFRPKTHGREDVECQGRERWPPAEMVEILMQENSSLKAELETCYQKVSKSQKVRS